MSVFHAYDIRGIYSSEITEEFAYAFGKALFDFKKPKTVVVGYDSRKGNIQLFSNFSKALIEEGCDVTHIGLVTRPMLNMVAWKKHYDLGIIITASHNPKEYNGFKVVMKNSEPMDYETGLNIIESKIFQKRKSTKSKKGKIISKDYIDMYVDFLSENLTKQAKKFIAKKNFKIIGDATNGSAGEIIKRFMEKNEIRYELLFGEPDGNFPCHNTNPLDNNALVVLSNTVVKNKATFGFIVDPDADRIRFVDEKGGIIDNNYAASLVIKYLLKKNPKTSIVHDLVCRKIVSETIRRNSGKEIVAKVGFSNMNRAMKQHNAIFGAEVSGHYAFKKMNYLDSGLFMLVEFINMYSNTTKKLSTLVKPLNKYVDAGEINYRLPTIVQKENILKNIHEHFKKNRKKLDVKKILLIDGVSVITNNVWFNVRPSNTEPLLRLRIEGRKKKDVDKTLEIIKKFIPK